MINNIKSWLKKDGKIFLRISEYKRDILFWILVVGVVTT